MHITPENLPIKHIYYFFNPNKIIEPVSKVYEDYSGRQIEVGDKIDFMHKKSFIADVLAILNKLGVRQEWSNQKLYYHLPPLFVTPADMKIQANMLKVHKR